MTSHKIQIDGQAVQEDSDGLRVFYEIYPDLTLQVENAAGTWFEIALHIEVEEHRPPDHPKSREAFSILMGVADRMVECVKSYVPYGLEMPMAYHTLHPRAAGRPAPPRLARSISLVFSDIGPYTLHAEPDILARLRAELAHLGIPRLERAGGGGCQ